MLTCVTDKLTNTNLFVIAATNYPNNIDPALRRPGRLDRELQLIPPNQSERLKNITLLYSINACRKHY